MERAIDALGHVSDLACRPFGQVLGGAGANAVTLAIVLVPLDLGRGELGSLLGHAAEIHLPYREGFQAPVADHPHVQLAALDELLRQRIAAGLLVDESHALLQFLLVLYQRSLGQAQ